MRVAALGDAHLGRSYLPVTAPDGVNQRERDFEVSFEAAVGLCLDQEPDLVVWLGDVFDHPRPPYRSYRVAQRALSRLRDHGVAVVVISGNHDTPRLPGTESPYSALADTFPEVRFAHHLAYERFELAGLVVHAVPQMLTVDATLDALAQAERSRSQDRSNLLLTHPRLIQLQPRYADINEIEVDVGSLQSDFVLLGHYHVHAAVAPGIWYAGSTDSFTFADDPDQPKGIVVLETETGECRHVALRDQRRLVSAAVSAQGLSPGEVAERVLEAAAAFPAGAVARLYLDQVDPEAYRLLDLTAVREAARATLHLHLEPTLAGAAHAEPTPDLASMPSRGERFMAGQREELEGFDRDRLRRQGHDYLTRAVESAG